MRATGERYSCDVDGDAEANTGLLQNEAVKRGDRAAARMMMPFALLVLVVLFFVARMVLFASGGGGAQGVSCGEGYQRIEVRQGDTCWAIAKVRGVRVDELLKVHGNEGLECERLRVGQGICVPN